jgi:LysR family transcriptional regulator, low CO2-responsive transcriptional regulator
MINLHHLRIFYSVAKRMSYTKAAGDLFISQPAVTNQIRAFEEQLGFKLFEGKPHKVLLTEGGKFLYEYARRLSDLETEIENAVNNFKGLRAGVVSLGTSRTYSHTFLHLLISHFHMFYPNIIVKVDEAGSMDIIQRLLDFQNELAICVKVEDNQDICFIPFCREELLVALPAGHQLSGEKSISIRSLADEKIILRGKGSASRYLVNQLFEKSGMSLQIHTEANNTELIKNMVQKGEGISFLSRIAMSREIDEGKLAALSLEEDQINLDINIAYLKNHVLSNPAAVFLKVLQELALCDKPVGSAAALISALQGHSDL